MNEYISREDAKNALLNKGQHTTRYRLGETWELNFMEILEALDTIPTADVQPIDKDNMHIIYIGRKAYLAENTIMEFMKKMDIIRDSLAHIENYFDTYAETIRQINACGGRCTDITEVKYFIDRIKENSGYD